MKKYIILLFLVFILSGCSSEYNLKVTSDKLEEKIFMTIDKSMIDNEVISSEVEPDDQITPILKDDLYPMVSSSKIYNKEVTEDENNYYVKLNYEFTPDTYKNATSLNTCFENHEYINQKDFYEIKLSGKFYCLYGDSMDINIDTPNIVKENNATTHSGDKYSWTINSSNVDNVDISIKILKKTKLANYITIALIGILLMTVVIGGLIISAKLSKRKNINEI